MGIISIEKEKYIDVLVDYVLGEKCYVVFNDNLKWIIVYFE